MTNSTLIKTFFTLVVVLLFVSGTLFAQHSGSNNSGHGSTVHNSNDDSSSDDSSSDDSSSDDSSSDDSSSDDSSSDDGNNGNQIVFNVDFCDSARLMVCSDVFTGNTTTAINDGLGLPSCGTAFNPGRDNWYLVEGTGQTMTVTTCHLNSDFDTNIQVWRDIGNSCSLTCVDGNDDIGSICQIGPPVQSFRSQVTWASVPGDSYKIRVSGFSGATGNYGLTLSCAAAKSDPAEQALSLLDQLSTSLTVFPNPLSTQTTFSINVAEAGDIILSLYSVAGVKVAELFNGTVEAGSEHKVNLDASKLSSGVYFYHLIKGSEVVRGKITLTK